MFPSTNTTVAAARQNIAKAKSLLSRPATRSGFSTQLIGNDVQEISDYAQIVAQSAKPSGSTSASRWRHSRLLRQVHVRQLGLAGRHHEPGRLRPPRRAERVPGRAAADDQRQEGHRARGTRRTSATRSTTSWWQQYTAAVDLSTQRQIAGQIQTLLLNETPIIYAYFYNYLTATAKNVNGAYPTAIGHIFLTKATKS